MFDAASHVLERHPRRRRIRAGIRATGPRRARITTHFPHSIAFWAAWLLVAACSSNAPASSPTLAAVALTPAAQNVVPTTTPVSARTPAARLMTPMASLTPPLPSLATASAPAQTPQSEPSLRPTPPTPEPEPTSGEAGWIGPELISTRHYEGPAMVIDADGNAHVAAQLGNDIYYVTNVDGSWTRQLLAAAPRGTRLASPLIDLDHDGSIGVAYDSRCRDCAPDFPEATWFTSNASGGWSDPVRLVEGGASQLDLHESTVHLLYTDTNGEGIEDLNDVTRLLYASSVGGETSTVELANIGVGHELRVSGAGTVEAIYATWEPGQSDRQMLRYATRHADSAEFTVDDLPLPQADYSLSAVIADGGEAHIVFSTVAIDGGTASSPAYLRQGDAGWTEPVPFGAELPTAIDASPEALHAVGGSDEIWYATSDALDPLNLGCCVFEGVYYTTYPTVAVDRDGRPHVFYTTADGTWYAVGPGG